jgi:hypothetical protein
MTANGKGSAQRGDAESRRKYAEGWDSIFRKNTKGVHKGRKRLKAKLKPYPHWVCSPCGDPVCKRRGGWEATWGMGTCDVCNAACMVTEARDFGYPDWPGHETHKESVARWMRARGFLRLDNGDWMSTGYPLNPNG